MTISLHAWAVAARSSIKFSERKFMILFRCDFSLPFNCPKYSSSSIFYRLKFFLSPFLSKFLAFRGFFLRWQLRAKMLLPLCNSVFSCLRYDFQRRKNRALPICVVRVLLKQQCWRHNLSVGKEEAPFAISRLQLVHIGISL